VFLPVSDPDTNVKLSVGRLVHRQLRLQHRRRLHSQGKRSFETIYSKPGTSYSKPRVGRLVPRQLRLQHRRRMHGQMQNNVPDILGS